jgi:drug/metabolite transporter (DMT)-like permease
MLAALRAAYRAATRLPRRSLPVSMPATPSIAGAALWMLGALGCFAAMAIGGRELSAELGTFQILFMRSVVGVLVLLALLLATGGVRQVRTRRAGLHALRNLAHFGGQYGWFLGIALIPLAQVFAIEFTMPIWTLLLAMLFLGERATLARVAAVALGVAGVLLILRPGGEPISLGAIAVLGGAFGYALAYVLTKRLVSTEAPIAIVFYMTVMQLPLGLVPALADWHWPSAGLWPWVVVVGLTALGAHYCISRAMALADAMVVVPMDFLRLPLIAIVGAIFYAEPLDPWVFAGAALMVAGNLVNLRAGQAVAR